jgi:signal transduction histidine kinase
VLRDARSTSDATSVRIDVRRMKDRLLLTVIDNGIGGADARHGTGLLGLIDRIEALGGSLPITSSPG